MRYLLILLFPIITHCFYIAPNNNITNLEDVHDGIRFTNFDSFKWRFTNKNELESELGKNATECTYFYLYSKATGLNYSNIILGNISSVIHSPFDVSKTTKVLIHGWLDTPFREFGYLMRDAYLEGEDVNLIHVDWSKLADTISYPKAWAAVVPVGKFIAQFLDWLVTEVGVSVDNIHVIGHSLGGQIAGVIGEHVTVGKIGRISGLDPAGPGFGPSKSGRLDQSDAQFVDVIHTCGHWSGYYYPCGHVDFYPNRGVYNQPGCPWDIGGCSHLRVYHLFAESVSSLGFVSRECDSWRHYVKGNCDNNTVTVMGEHVDTGIRGKFYLHTAGSSPFAMGD